MSSSGQKLFSTFCRVYDVPEDNRQLFKMLVEIFFVKSHLEVILGKRIYPKILLLKYDTVIGL